jgi:hypothetical protein
MRTTLNISDDVLEQVKQYAAARSMAMGEATSGLLKRALRQSFPVRQDGHFFVFSPAEGAGTLTLEHALRIEDESE